MDVVCFDILLWMQEKQREGFIPIFEKIGGDNTERKNEDKTSPHRSSGIYWRWSIFVIASVLGTCSSEPTPPIKENTFVCCIPLSVTDPQSACVNFDQAFEKIIFVDGLSGLDENKGSPIAPVRSIGQGLKLAAQQRKQQVYVSTAVYSERIELLDGISIAGGFSRNLCWNWDPSFTVLIQNPTPMTGASIGVRGSDIFQPTTLAYLDIHSADAQGESQSSYGLYLLRSTGVILDHLHIQAGNGVHGKNGTNGVDGVSGSNAGNPAERQTCVGATSDIGLFGGNGGSGGFSDTKKLIPGGQGLKGGGVLGGTGGLGGLPMKFDSPTGKGEDGYPGDPGQNGSNGMDGDGGSGGSLLFGILWASQNGGDGTSGFDGGGGGGGGGSGTIVINYGPDSPSGINGVCGGGAGGGGQHGTEATGGMGGGGSFGLVTIHSLGLVVKDCTISSSHGGDGGGGGVGGAGGSGGRGNEGDQYKFPLMTTPPGNGGRGGNGGNGGRGGHGGGGAGGPSVSILISDGEPNFQGENQMTPGSAGNGGISKGNPGQQGATATVMRL